MKPDYDLLIVGGGVNGAGIARDAAGRGMSVLLVEAGDLAGATSSASTKLIHGGLRYLEYYEFRLVREALREREILLGLAPHIIKPLDFVLPHVPGVRPAWMVRLGLYLYDHLGPLKKLKASSAIDLSTHAYGRPLKEENKKGFVYADGWVQDARLVVLNALDAAELGAHVLTRTACTSLKAVDGYWEADLQDTITGQAGHCTASMVVNAAGPWVHGLLEANDLVRAGVTRKLRLVKGSHIIVPRLFDGDQAYILQQPDRRIVFAIPFEDQFTLIGTTDVDYHDDPACPAIDEDEKTYLCEAVNRFFSVQTATADIVHTYSGVRPLLDDGRGSASAVTRDYNLEFDLFSGAPILSVFGGKITTYRRLAEDAVNKLVPHWPRAQEYPASQGNWTATIPLPGGDVLNGDIDGFIADQIARYPWLPPELLRRYALSYGTRMDRMLNGAVDINSLGRHFGDGIYMAEVEYLRRYEWARSAEDILWRRSKMLLHVSETTLRSLELYLS